MGSGFWNGRRNVSFDLIYSLPEQNSKSWIKDLKRATDLLQEIGGRHISCYQLTIEDESDENRD